MKEYVFLFPELSLEEVFHIAVDDLMRNDLTNEEFGEQYDRLMKQYKELKRNE